MNDLSLETPEAHDDLDGVPSPPATLTLSGHENEWRELVAAGASGRLHHAWLFQGPRGIGKATTAFAFARHLLAGPRPDEPE
ncbi:MAG TPA: DNA polymerase III subunit delta', partial [Aurantimonas coralicida]|nr:DNA polymerase III subunit delta' [Aurantimonas coralicida]